MQLRPDRTNPAGTNRTLCFEPRLKDGLIGQLFNEPRDPVACPMDRIEGSQIKDLRQPTGSCAAGIGAFLDG
jgi:hypothetical protein